MGAIWHRRPLNSAKPSASLRPNPSANGHPIDHAHVPHRWNRGGRFKQPQIKAKFDGVMRYNDLRLVELEDGNNIV